MHGSESSTYVAEQNLESDVVLEPINHPMVEQFFAEFDDGRYVRVDRDN